MTPKTKTPEALREQAEKLAREAAEVQAELDAHTLQQYEREQAEQRKADEKFVREYKSADFDQAVQDAEREVSRIVEEMPITQAMAALIAAEGLRNWAASDAAGALSRLGRPTEGVIHSGRSILQGLQEYIDAAAVRLGQQQIDTERQENNR